MKRNRWLIDLYAMGLHLCIGRVYAWSVLTKPIMESMGFTLKETTWTFSLAILFLGLSAGFLGSFVQKIGPRKSGLLSMTCFVTAMFGTAAALYAHSLPMLYAFYGVIGGIGLGTGYITPVSTLVKWFPENRGFATGMNFISYWFSDSMVLKAYRAQEVGEDHYLYRIVADLAQRAELPMPKVYIIPTEVPNAFATGRSPSHAAVAATAGILDLLDEDEIRGVLAHEMSHILHRDILISTIVATFASAIGMIANIAQWAAIFGGGRDDDGDGNPIALLVTAIVAPLAASIIQLGISRTREYMADEEGGRMIDDPIALARALAKIDNYAHHYALPGATKATAHMCIINPFAGAGSAIANLFSTHPPTEQRIERLEELDKELHD